MALGTQRIRAPQNGAAKSRVRVWDRVRILSGSDLHVCMKDRVRVRRRVRVRVSSMLM